ncbi:MAG: hypothetical protein N3H31_07985, partial [Candidatus Nezhaarchaeota archaeon]|nr:hypothetical protein [Candidatus Nezhaarchaeota archaeon]
LRLRLFKRFEALMDRLCTVGRVSRKFLEEKFGPLVDEAIRLGWADEDDGYVHPTNIAKLLWEQRYMRWRP